VTVETAEHRRLGVELFNHVWTLLEKPERTRGEDDEMVHAAHASAYHWRQVGTPANFARSEWQCSRVYAVLGRAEPALWHARRCLELVETHPDEMEPWDEPFAHEALARAYGVAGDAEAANRHAERARAGADSIDGDEDREHLLAALATLGA
jgi:hypothetical protein